jgi:hypothetical protein
VRTHAGLVRCGACRGIFDAREHLVEGELSPAQQDDHDDSVDNDANESPHTIVPGIPAVRHAPTIDADSHANAARAVNFSATPTNDSPSIRRDPIIGDSANDSANVEPPSSERANFEWKSGARPLSPWERVGYGAAALLLCAVLLAQTAYWFRDEIASYVPASAPILTRLCQPLHCQISPPQRASDLGFVGADLAADPAHKGLLIFTATLRNTGSRAAALPTLILTLDAVGGEPLARRAFSPAQYAPANANLARGLEAAGELEIKLYIDASPMTPVGFKVDHTYL